MVFFFLRTITNLDGEQHVSANASTLMFIAMASSVSTWFVVVFPLIFDW